MPHDRITHDQAVMGGKPCVRGLPVTVGAVLNLLAAGSSADEVVRTFPGLEPADVPAALAYAAWRLEEPGVVA